MIPCGDDMPAGFEKQAHRRSWAGRTSSPRRSLVTISETRMCAATEIGFGIECVGMSGDQTHTIGKTVARNDIRCHLRDRGVHLACHNLRRAARAAIIANRPVCRFRGHANRGVRCGAALRYRRHLRTSSRTIEKCHGGTSPPRNLLACPTSASSGHSGQ
jgi:hypothetical protein